VLFNNPPVSQSRQDGTVIALLGSLP